MRPRHALPVDLPWTGGVMTITDQELRRERNLTVARRYRKRRQLAALQGIESGPIAAADVRAHSKRLLELGWSAKAQVEMIGAGTTTGLLLIVNGNTVRAERKWEAILSLPPQLEACWRLRDAALGRLQAPATVEPKASCTHQRTEPSDVEKRKKKSKHQA